MMKRDRVGPNRDHECVHDGLRSRRHVLVGLGSASIALAGCLGDDESTDAPAEPISLDDGQTCDVCGMRIDDHHGPAGQVFYADGKPAERDGPAWFDSIRELTVYHEERRDRGWDLRDVFVTDYAAVEYAIVERDETLYISSHVEADTFVDATTVDYVVDSTVEGAMGPEFLPFSDSEAAVSFTEEYNGALRSWEELPSLVT